MYLTAVLGNAHTFDIWLFSEGKFVKGVYATTGAVKEEYSLGRPSGT